jgi:beta-phosphoglucomutase-like phosphatase (HAD superfamily)
VAATVDGMIAGPSATTQSTSDRLFTPAAVIFDAALLAAPAVRVLRRIADTVPVAATSGSSWLSLEATLARHGLDKLLSAWVSADDVSSPEHARRMACVLLGTTPDDTLSVEDTPQGIQAARAAGMPVLGVGPQAEGADIVVPDLDSRELQRWLNQWAPARRRWLPWPRRGN